MKKMIMLTAGLFLFLTSCNSDDDASPAEPTPSSNEFSIDGTTYSLAGPQSFSDARFPAAITAGSTVYNRSQITVSGLNGLTKSGTVSFDLYYKNGQAVGGTYEIYDDAVDNDVESFTDFITSLDRACMGWTSMGAVFNLSGGSLDLNANNPSGTVKVIVNSETNYTLQFSGNFKVYDDGFNFVRNVPVSINVTGAVYFPN